jgi:hypothetical protein
MKDGLDGHEQELNNGLRFFLLPLLALASPPPLNEIVEDQWLS